MNRITSIVSDKIVIQALENAPKTIVEHIENTYGIKEYQCTNCKHINIFKRNPSKPVSENIAGYCKNCGHVVWK